MVLYFITGNSEKFKEVKAIIPKVKQINLDLPEIQELNPKTVIKEKLKEAQKIKKGEFICEDTSLYIKSLNGFPGPLIKWFLKSLNNKGIYQLVNKYNNKTTTAKTIIGYAKNKEIKFFQGNLTGKIVKPKGRKGFGWDSIFKPKGFNKTLAEMTPEEKNKISMRKKALVKLNNYLNSSRN